MGRAASNSTATSERPYVSKSKFPVGAIQIETTAVVDQDKCIGCGVCATVCEEKSIKMVRRPEDEIARLDAEFMEAFGNVISRTKPDPLVMRLFGG